VQLEIGQKIYVARDEEAETYVTSLQDVTKRHLLVGVPYHRGNPLILAPGDGVLVTYVSSEAAYRFSSICRGRKMDRIPLYLLERPEKVERIQRRRMVRVPVTLEVRGREKLDYSTPVQGERWFTSDLSGGGVCLICGRPLVPGTRLVLEFLIPAPAGPRQIITLGRVNRLEKLEDDDLDRYAVGVEFEGLAKADEDAIVAFLFRKMAEERRLR
jgi:c-di-GMP-binding flagellar brake protein YcgR